MPEEEQRWREEKMKGRKWKEEKKRQSGWWEWRVGQGARGVERRGGRGLTSREDATFKVG